MPDHVNIITDPTETAKLVREKYVAYELGCELKKHYPGRIWLVKVDVDNGIADIVCPSIAPSYGYMIHIDAPVHELRHKAKIAGGEILERFGLSRDRSAGEDIEGLKKNRLGIVEGLANGGI